MKKLLLTLAAAAALAVPAAAQAAPSHSCGIGDGGWVTASYHTSCPFAGAIANAFIEGDCYDSDGFCSGHVFSPVTDETYRVDCIVRGHYPESVYCYAVGTTAWVRFVYKDE